MSDKGFGDVAVPVLILFGVLALAYLGMWRGWRNRARRHRIPELVPAPDLAHLPPALLQADARYFGTTVADHWLDRVVARGLGTRTACRLSLSGEGLDVLRPDGGFRIPASALRAARHDQGIAGKVVPPHGLLVVTWQHGDVLLDSGFRLTDPVAGDAPDLSPRRGFTAAHDHWIRSVTTIAKEHTA